MDLFTSAWDWLRSLKWNSLVGPIIAILALLFTIASFWWLNARQGKLRSYRPHTFAHIKLKTQFRLRFPLVLYNTGPKPIVVRDLRLSFPKQLNATVLPWRSSRSQLKPETEDGEQLPAVFAVPGRQTQQHFIEFGIDTNDPLPGIDLTTSSHEVHVEVLLGDKRRWKRLVAFPLHNANIKPANYIAYRNDAVRT